MAERNVAISGQRYKAVECVVLGRLDRARSLPVPARPCRRIGAQQRPRNGAGKQAPPDNKRDRQRNRSV